MEKKVFWRKTRAGWNEVVECAVMDSTERIKVKLCFARLRNLSQVGAQLQLELKIQDWSPNTEWCDDFDDAVNSLATHINLIAERVEKKAAKQDLCDIVDELDDTSLKVIDDIHGTSFNCAVGLTYNQT